MLDAPRIDPVLLSIANLFINGTGIDDIADQTSVPRDRVVQVLENSAVKKYIDTVYQTQGYLNKFRRLDLLNKIIEHKLEKVTKALENGEEGDYTSKDLLDVLEHLRKLEEGSKEKKATGPTVAVQVNNYDKLNKILSD